MTFTNRIADAGKLQQEINKHRPLKGQSLKQLQEYFRIGLTWSSNALEGNSLTETETKVVIEDGITIGGKPLRDHFEAIGHAEAFDYLQKLANRKEITERDILKLHKLFYYRIDEANAGHYRKQNIIFTGTDFVFPAPSELKGLMAAFAVEIPTSPCGEASHRICGSPAHPAGHHPPVRGRQRQGRPVADEPCPAPGGLPGDHHPAGTAERVPVRGQGE